MVMAEDPTTLTSDTSNLKEWSENTETWQDVYSKKPVEYLEAIARGETPVWDSQLKKYVYTDSTETVTVDGGGTVLDPQKDSPTDNDLPF